MSGISVRIKEKLNANSLIELLENNFAGIEDNRDDNKSIELSDIIMSAYAMFSLKLPSLLAFRNRYANDTENLKSIFGISKVPSDTEMREVIDKIDPIELQAIFSKIFYRLQRAKQLEPFKFLGEYYLISGDGTEYFSSKKICCDNCMERKLKDGSIEYYHQFYGASVVHPDLKQVIPLAPEPIIRQDGNIKNDCERNASKRWLENFRKYHPKLPGIIIEDALSPNAPHINEIIKHNLHFILSVKESDHKFMFDYINKKKEKDKVHEHTICEVQEHTIIKGHITHIFSFINDVPLNKSNQDLKVNFLEYWEVDNKTGKTQHFSFVTDFKINIRNVYDIMRGGRARWKIENETYNTLKNKEYQFEHNYGHGKENLSVNLSILMMLTFLIDQTLEISCNLFQAALAKTGQRTDLWDGIRHLFYSFLVDSMNQMYEAIIFGHKKNNVQILNTKKDKIEIFDSS